MSRKPARAAGAVALALVTVALALVTVAVAGSPALADGLPLPQPVGGIVGPVASAVPTLGPTTAPSAPALPPGVLPTSSTMPVGPASPAPVVPAPTIAPSASATPVTRSGGGSGSAPDTGRTTLASSPAAPRTAPATGGGTGTAALAPLEGGTLAMPYGAAQPAAFTAQAPLLAGAARLPAALPDVAQPQVAPPGQTLLTDVAQASPRPDNGPASVPAGVILLASVSVAGVSAAHLKAQRTR